MLRSRQNLVDSFLSISIKFLLFDQTIKIFTIFSTVLCEGTYISFIRDLRGLSNRKFVATIKNNSNILGVTVLFIGEKTDLQRDVKG